MPIYGSSGITGARMHRSNVACLPYFSTWTQPPTAPLELRSNVVRNQVPNINRVNAIVESALDDPLSRSVTTPRPQEKFGKTLERFSGEVSTQWSSSLRGSKPRYEGSPFSLTPRRNADFGKRSEGPLF